LSANRDEARRYFEGEAADDFDAIYDNEGGTLTRFINRVFRKGMRERVELTLLECERTRGTVLDVGCGSGRVSIMMAKRGMRVIGIDYSQRMIELARGYLDEERKRSGVDLDVEFITADFMESYDPESKFEMTVALGVFDYVPDPGPFLEKMASITDGKMISAFPDRFAFQMPLRKLWLQKRGCPVFFYSEKDVRKLHEELGFDNYDITRVSAGFLVKAVAREALD